MRLTVDKSGRKGTLKLKGMLTISQAEDLKKALVKALKKVTELEVDLQKVDEIDIACLQLLCAAHKTASKSNKKLVLGNDISDEIIHDIMSSGYFRPVGCINKDRNKCLWKEGGSVL
jgi:anti-anti-sigma factor